MASQERNIIRRRIANAYLSSVISISLVLMLIGIAALLIVNARSVSDYFKESLQVSVLMKQEVSEKQAEEYRKAISGLPFVRTTRLVSKEEGTEELKQMLGEDFLSVFESSPVPLSIDVSLRAEYVSPDSLEFVKSKLSAYKIVDEIECQQSLVEALNANLAKISLVLGIFILLMLFVSFVLINNTVRLSVFSRRFTIHTMQLVGATRSFIRKPFLVSAVWQGLVAAVIAVAALAAMLLAVKRSFEALFTIFRLQQMLVVAGVVVVCGVLICVLSTYFVVNKLVGLTRNDLYY
ncbi:MAG: permease-like cell division protein FtsX [Bacteroidales bacterium]|nr:permease-like cell division protein FtsX [Bacteroidales bacterium]